MKGILICSLIANCALGGFLFWIHREYVDMSAWARNQRERAEKLADQCGKLRIELAEAKQAFSEVRPVEAQKSADEYAVTGSPRPLPWHIRKKELESKHRRKRQHIDELRESA
jgi:hypothetical protein